MARGSYFCSWLWQHGGVDASVEGIRILQFLFVFGSLAFNERFHQFFVRRQRESLWGAIVKNRGFGVVKDFDLRGVFAVVFNHPAQHIHDLGQTTAVGLAVGNRLVIRRQGCVADLLAFFLGYQPQYATDPSG